MSEILTLASDFIERMANPAYGTALNEEYSLRFAELLSRERLGGLLREEASGLKNVTDVNALGGHGWLWFLNWARTNDVPLNDDLLLDLADRWSSVFVQILIIDIATREAESRPWTSQVENFPHKWLRRLLLRAIREEEREPQPSERFDAPREEPPRTARAETTLIALMQVGRPVTLAAAATLLQHAWRGHEQLVAFVASRLAVMDADTRGQWERYLRMGQA